MVEAMKEVVEVLEGLNLNRKEVKESGTLTLSGMEWKVSRSVRDHLAREPCYILNFLKLSQLLSKSLNHVLWWEYQLQCFHIRLKGLNKRLIKAIQYYSIRIITERFSGADERLATSPGIVSLCNRQDMCDFESHSVTISWKTWTTSSSWLAVEL